MTDPMMEKAMEIAKNYPGHHPMSNQVERLANDIALALREAVEEEREANAKICDDSAKLLPGPPGYYDCTMTPHELARAIRSRTGKAA